MISVPGGSISLAVNTVTNKIYVSRNPVVKDLGSDQYVTIVDGATNKTTHILVDRGTNGIVINPVNHKVYFGSAITSSVLILDELTYTTVIRTGVLPGGMALNAVNNKVYIANQKSNDVTIIDGDTNATTTIPVGPTPGSIAVNPITKMCMSPVAIVIM